MTTADFSLAGRVAIVTGGSRGIGRSIAVALAEHGADIAVAARKPEAIAEAVAAVEATGRRCIGVPTNVRRVEELERLVAETKRQLGRVDILVNNAATNLSPERLEDTEEGAWDATVNTNVRSPFFLSKLAREAMLEHGDGGSIVNVSSTGGLRTMAGLAPPYAPAGAYAVSKRAIIMLTQVCAQQWGTDGIRVNCILPGLVAAGMSEGVWQDPDVLARVVSSTALRRVGEAEEMAGAVVYLASDAASYVTGQRIVVDGGGIL